MRYFDIQGFLPGFYDEWMEGKVGTAQESGLGSRPGPGLSQAGGAAAVAEGERAAHVDQVAGQAGGQAPGWVPGNQYPYNGNLNRFSISIPYPHGTWKSVLQPLLSLKFSRKYILRWFCIAMTSP